MALIALAATLPTLLSAAVRPASWVSDGMVLQRGIEVSLVGTADPGEVFVVKFVNEPPRNVNGKRVSGEYSVVTGSRGQWSFTLPALRPGGPYSLQLADKVIADVYVGDVFLCSGQSNMELPVERVYDMYYQEVNAASDPQVRMMRIETNPIFDGPTTELKTDGWKALNKDNSAKFSAAAYFFAREMRVITGVPVGVVQAAVGGTPIEAWMSRDALADFPSAIAKLDYAARTDYRRAAESFAKVAGDEWEALLSAKENALALDWTKSDFDDSAWETIDATSASWGSSATGDKHGAHWLRKEVTLTAEQIVDGAVLRLGTMVDADIAYVNGVKVGQTYYQYPPRIYDVPASALKVGKNVIAVRLVSQNGRPELTPEKYRGLFFGGKRWLSDHRKGQLGLDGNWKHLYAVPMPPKPGIAPFIYTPTALYNGMVAPLKGMKFLGALWYQGESNVGRDVEYRKLLPALMTCWRTTFGIENMAFVIGELADFKRPVEPAWRRFQDMQREVATAEPNADFSQGRDLGEWNDIHPLDKKIVGQRMAWKMRDICKLKKHAK